MRLLPWLLAFNTAVAADGLATHAALQRPGVHEGNPIVAAHPALVLGASAVGGSVLAVWLDRHGHPTLARTGLVIGATAHGVAATWNVQVGR